MTVVFDWYRLLYGYALRIHMYARGCITRLGYVSIYLRERVNDYYPPSTMSSEVVSVDGLSQFIKFNKQFAEEITNRYGK